MLSLEQKLEIIRFWEGGMKTPKIAKTLNITVSVVRKWVKVFKKKVQLKQKWEGQSLVY
jgi:transposase